MQNQQAMGNRLEILHIDPSLMHDHALTTIWRRVHRGLGYAVGFLALAFLLFALVGDSHAANFAKGSRDFRTIELTFGKAEVIQLSRDAGEILVGDSAIADARVPSPRRIYLLGRQLGNTTVFVFDPDGEIITRLEIHVRIDELTLNNTMQRLVPQERELEISTVNGDVILAGSVSSPAAADRVRRVARRFVTADENVVDMMDVAGELQVLLRVRIVELSREAIYELGTELNFGDGLDPNNSVDFLFNALPAVGLSATPFGIGQLLFSPGGFGPLSLIINALEQDGLIQVLAEPNLTAITGETAQFLVGGEFPIPIDSDDDGVTIQFRPFGVSLAFTPTVLSEDRISLRLGTEVSALSNEAAIVLAGTTVPSLTVNRAETVVEMGSGGSLMIAGLIQSEGVKNASGLPGIKDVPVLGQLARSDAFSRNESEVVIMVTPILVKPYRNGIAQPVASAPRSTSVELGMMDRLKTVYGDEALTGLDGPAATDAPGYLLD
ncbi:MAG: type II and III secretion system protein family protein [Alphaproteobacteria bacterium]|nr:type II and III secretion system protein family protein [Alphaproteobacteria bacterium SS10]